VLLERPLTARSAIASLLLGMRTPRLSGARLVRWCGIFGIAEGTARVALSRMVDRGELHAQDGRYELAGRIRRRQPVQEWSLSPRLHQWTGEWRIGVVVGTARAAPERVALRNAMRELRMAELREGVWLRPDNLPRPSASAEAWRVAGDQVSWWTGQPEVDAAMLARDLFDAGAWASRARWLRDRLERITHDLRAADDDVLARAFLTGAATLAHVRADPLLPAQLCPRPWPGDAIRVAYRDFQASFATALRDWFRAGA
jgi:phenylacetic acid degradation operon negative regulatory protein